MGDVVASVHLGHSDQEMLVFSVLGEVRMGASRTFSLDLWREDFSLFRTLIDRVPWELVLKSEGVQKGWMCFKNQLLNIQGQALPICREASGQRKRLAWLNRELWLELREKKRIY